MRQNLKAESDESDHQGMFEIDENGYSSKKSSKNNEYLDKKNRSKKKLVVNHKLHEHPKTSTYSSSSRLTSFLKGQSISDAEITPFKYT